MYGEFTKKELIHIHLLLFQVKRAFEFAGIGNEFFARYNEMGVLPVQISRHKDEHWKAVLNLCFGILKAIGKDGEAEDVCRKLYEEEGRKKLK